MTQPSFSCPRCGYTTFLPSDVSAGYCPVCRWWTGDSLLGSEDVLAQAEIDGPFAERWSSREIDGDPLSIRWSWSGMVTGDGSGEALPEMAFCLLHEQIDCCPDNGTVSRNASRFDRRTQYTPRSELEREWFGVPVHVAYDPSWFGAPITWPPRDAPTFRVARFVQALRRLRHR